MALRIHELHPSLVHYPLAFVPLAVLCDLIGRATGSRALMKAGARLMPIGAASAALAGAAGLAAQGAVEVGEDAHDMLVTHRNLNLGLIAASIGLAALRRRTGRPSIPYLAAGLAGVAAMNYTAYLGGKLVYQHGLGVEKAGDVQLEKSPELRRGQAAEALSASIAHARDTAKHTVEHLKSGEVAPTLARPG